jgi:hypothetical protein
VPASLAPPPHAREALVSRGGASGLRSGGLGHGTASPGPVGSRWLACPCAVSSISSVPLQETLAACARGCHRPAPPPPPVAVPLSRMDALADDTRSSHHVTVPPGSAWTTR